MAPEATIRRATLFWGLATVLVLMAGVGLRHPWPADEPRFAQIAREMVESGQWLFPTRGGEFYPDKPPVFIWLSALSYKVIGELKWSFLLPSALAAVATLWLVQDLGRRLWNVQTSLFAVLVLVFTPQFLVQGKAAQMDALVALWITLGCYGLLRHFLVGPHWGWYLLSWVAMALGIMTKGVGFLPLLMLLPLAWWARQSSPGAGSPWRWNLLAGPAVMLLTLACWLVPMLVQVELHGGPELRAYRDDLLFRQTGERFVNAWHHVKPWHYFFTQAIPTIWLPLAVLLVVFWRQLFALLKEDPKARILLVWVGLVLLFFSLSSGKREVYILPALPMLALVVAALWVRVREHPLASRTAAFMQFFLMLSALAVAGLGLAAMLAPQGLPLRWQEYREPLGEISALLVGLGVGWFVLLVYLRGKDLFVRLAASSLAIWLCVSLLIWPVVDPYRTPQRLMQELEQRLPPGDELGLMYFKEQFLLFAQRPLTHFSYLAPLSEQERNAWLWMREAPGRHILVPTDAALSCFDTTRSELLGEAHRREWVLLGKDSLAAACELPSRPQRFIYRPQTRGVLP